VRFDDCDSRGILYRRHKIEKETIKAGDNAFSKKIF